jgi:hypothetical protein
MGNLSFFICTSPWFRCHLPDFEVWSPWISWHQVDRSVNVAHTQCGDDTGLLDIRELHDTHWFASTARLASVGIRGRAATITRALHWPVVIVFWPVPDQTCNLCLEHYVGQLVARSQGEITRRGTEYTRTRPRPRTQWWPQHGVYCTQTGQSGRTIPGHSPDNHTHPRLPDVQECMREQACRWLINTTNK